MALNKNSNGFTFGFAIAMVVFFGAILTIINLSLKDKQDKNAEVKKKMNILGAIKVDSNRDNAEGLFGDYVTDSFLINSKGERVDGSAFDVDIKKDFRDQSLSVEDKTFPLYKCTKSDTVLYVVPLVGKGLWGPIWGFVSVKEDFVTFYGGKFDHKTETPGLGAEIKEDEFQDHFSGYWGNKFVSERKLNMSADKYFEVIKGGQEVTKDWQVDGITGGTITSKGVEEMINRTFQIYKPYFDKQN